MHCDLVFCEVPEAAICVSFPVTLPCNFARFFSTVLRHTKVYLLALDSILVPSIYSTSSEMKPRSANSRTNVDGHVIRTFLCRQPYIMDVALWLLLYLAA